MGMSLTIGLLRLTDAAPVIVAYEKGLFAARGLDVRLSVEPSWANIADKLTYGRLQAAVMLPPLAFAIALGVRGAGTPLIVPMSLSLGGNTITVSRALADALAIEPDMGAAAIGARLRARRAGLERPLRFAVVHSFSTHNLLLRYWLAASGLAQRADVEISVVPPAETVDALAAGRIDGFCAGAPWGAVAARAGVGRTLLPSSAVWSNHPEKCLAVSEDWANANPAALEAMMTALLEAAQYCDAPRNAGEVAEILARDRYLAIDVAAIHDVPPTFFARAANFPWKSHANWFLQQMARWDLLPLDSGTFPIERIYRPDIYRAVAAQAGLTTPIVDAKPEGAHDRPWTLEGTLAPIEMGPDRFCDGIVFDS
jgi:NitT/TauT family transport system ATP-binding protein/nitrate/nitrite transport system substrate-binding protein